MPPRGTTGRSSSSTGARGPTGPKGQARSSPAGNKGGRAGSVSRTSPGPRGPTGPKGEVRGAVGRNAPTGRRGPTGPKGEPRAQTRSMVTGAGKRFGPMSNDVIDVRKRQGPIDPKSAFEKYKADTNRQLDANVQKMKQKTFSTQAGRLSKTGAQYGPMRAKIERDFNEKVAARSARSLSREDRPPLNVNAQTQRFRQEVSRMVPKTTLPSRMGMAEKAIGTYKRARNAFGNALYGNPPTAYKSGGFGMNPTRSSPRNKRGL